MAKSRVACTYFPRSASKPYPHHAVLFNGQRYIKFPDSDMPPDIDKINTQGEVIGRLWTEGKPPTYQGTFMNFVCYPSGQIVETPQQTPIQTVTLVGLNNLGQIIGSIYFKKTGTTTGYLWSPGHAEKLPLDPGAINDHGQIVLGHYLYSAGQLVDLGNLPESPGSGIISSPAAASINNAGEIVGTCFRTHPNPGSEHIDRLPKKPFIYKGGAMHEISVAGDPNFFNVAVSNDWDLLRIADNGDIIGERDLPFPGDPPGGRSSMDVFVLSPKQ